MSLFYLLNAFEALADPPAELPEGGCGLFNWNSWMKYPETHSLEVTLQKGGDSLATKFLKYFLLFSKCGSMIFGEKENLKSLSSLGDFPREDNFRKFSL